MRLGCQTCLRLIEDPSDGIFLNNMSDNSDELPIKEKLLEVVPELVLDSIEKVILCNCCVENLISAYKFKQGCLETQEKIYGFLPFVTQNEAIDVGKIAMHYRRLELIAEGITPVVEEPQVPQNCRPCEFSCAEDNVLIYFHVNYNPPYKCDHCSFIYPTIEFLREHVATHYKEKVFLCTLCDFITTLQEELTEHTVTHIAPCHCKQIGASYGRDENSNIHPTKVHETVKDVVKAPIIVPTLAQDLNAPKIPSDMVPKQLNTLKHKTFRKPRKFLKSKTSKLDDFGPSCKLTQTPSDMVLKQCELREQEASEPPRKVVKFTLSKLKSRDTPIQRNPFGEKSSKTKKSSLDIDKNDKTFQDKVTT